jgi:hypothetical protein
MSRMSPPPILSMTLAITVLAQGAGSACPFCSPSAGFPSIQRHLAKHEQAFLVRAVSRDAASGNTLHLRIDTVLKSPSGLTPGDFLPAPKGIPLQADSRYLVLVTKGTAGKPGSGRTRVLRLSADASTLARRLSLLPVSKSVSKDPSEKGDLTIQKKRLLLCLESFGNPDRLVAATVTHEFGAAPYAAVKALRPHLSARRITSWIFGRSCSPDHRGILFLLLAIEGSKAARETFLECLRDQHWQQRKGFDGLLGGYLLIHGEKGLAAVLATRPPISARNGLRVWYAESLLRALDFHLRYEDMISKATAYRTMHSLLDDPYAAGPAIGELIRKKHWASLEEVIAVRRRWAAERPSIDRATRAFLTACPKPDAKQILEAAGDKKRDPR